MTGALAAVHLAAPASSLELPGFSTSLRRFQTLESLPSSLSALSHSHVARSLPRASRGLLDVGQKGALGTVQAALGARPPSQTGLQTSGLSTNVAPSLPPAPCPTPVPALVPGLGRRRGDRQVASAVVANDGQRWWEKDEKGNMKDLHSTQEFVEALASGGDKLVIVEFFATWCGSCRALFPKLCKIAEQHPEILFYKVNFDENKPMCKSLNIKVLPYFHFYRGAEGRLDAFSASISKLQRLRDAIAIHNTDRCSLGPVLGEQDLSLPGASTSESSSADLSAAAGAR